ncbi:MAG: aminotransferase class IV [Myxococcales bacterium]|nr:aminotransferase class IV [Myxococcales bacterium]
MTEVVSIDGQLLPAAKATVSVLNRGFLYGDSAFEVLRTYQGRPFKGPEHLRRLLSSCTRLLIECPVSLDILAEEMHAALEYAGNAESYIRIIVTRGSGPVLLDLRTAQHPTRVIIVLPLPPQPSAMYQDGVEISLVASSRATDGSRAVGAKASNYQPNMLALHEAKKRGAYESVFVGLHGEVSEGASSNLFVVREGTIVTPPIRAGILEGITRRCAIDLARSLDHAVIETALFPSDLYGADEIFITSTLREIVPVVRVDGEPIGRGHPGSITQKVIRAFRSMTQTA